MGDIEKQIWNMLSEKEIKLFDFIKTSEDDVTIGLIEVLLGNTYVGALGKLIQHGLIVSDKIKVENTESIYKPKYVKRYKIKEV